MRTRASLGMPLESERGAISKVYSLDRVVKQRSVGHVDVTGQLSLINTKAVILARDQHGPIVQVLHRMVSPVMTMAHFSGEHSDC